MARLGRGQPRQPIRFPRRRATVGVEGYNGDVQLEGAGSLVVGVSLAVGAVAALSGVGSLTAGVVPAVSVAAALSGSGSLTATAAATAGASGAALLSGAGSLTADAAPAVTGGFTGTGSGALTTGEVLDVEGAAAFEGDGSLEASGAIVGAGTTYETDDFDRTTWGPDWVSIPSSGAAMTLNGAAVVGGTGGAAARREVPVPEGEKQLSEIEWLGGFGDGVTVAMPAFASTATIQTAGVWYIFRANAGNTGSHIAVKDAGVATYTNLITSSVPLAAHDIIGLEFDDITLRAYVNGTLRLQWNPTGPLSSQRHVGVAVGANTNNGIAVFDNWRGGQLSGGTQPEVTGTAAFSGTGDLSTEVEPAAAAGFAGTGSGSLSATVAPRPEQAAAFSGSGSLTATGAATTAASGVASFTGSGSLSAGPGGVAVPFSDTFNRTPGVVATSASYTQGVQGNGFYGTDEATGWNAVQNPGGLWRTDSANVTIVDDGTGNGLLTGDPTGWSGVTGWYRAHLTPNLVKLNPADGLTYSFRYKQSAFGLTNPTGIVGGDATDLWVAYQSQYTLIAIQFARQDNRIIAKRKVPTPGQSGNNYGTYYNLKHTTDSPLAGQYVGSAATYANLPTATKNAIAAAEGRAWSDTLATNGTATAGTWYDFSVGVSLVGADGLKIQLFRAGVLIGSWYDAFGITADNYHCPLHNVFFGEYETHHTTANGHNDPPENWMRRPIGNRTGSTGFRADNVQPWIDTFSVTSGAVGVKVTGGAQLTGSGSLLAGAGAAYAGAATFSGSGSLNAIPIPRPGQAAAFSGTGALTAAPSGTAVGVVSLTGVGLLSAAPKPGAVGGAVLAGTGTLTTVTTRAVAGTATFTGAGSLIAGAAVFAGTATLAGVGQLVVGVTAVTRTVVVSLSGTGSLVVGVSAVARAQVVAFAGTGSLTAAPGAGYAAAALLSGVGSLTAAPRLTAVGAVVLAGSGTLTVGTATARAGAAAFSGTGQFVAGTTLTVGGAVLLTGTGALSTTGLPTWVAVVAFSGTGQLSAAPRLGITAAVLLAGAGVLAATTGATAVATGVALLAGAGQLNASGRQGYGAGVSLTGVGSLIVGLSAVTARAVAALTGSGQLAASTRGVLATGAAFTGTGVLSAGVFVGYAGGVLFEGSGELAAGYVSPFPVVREPTGDLLDVERTARLTTHRLAGSLARAGAGGTLAPHGRSGHLAGAGASAAILTS